MSSHTKSYADNR